MNKQQVIDFLDKQNWIFAESYAQTYPHCYINKNKLEDKEGFVEVIQFIRRNGIVKQFYSKQYIYLEIGEYEYWDMGRPDRATIILNKAIIDDTKTYRHIKVANEDQEMLKKKIIERDDYLASLIAKNNLTDFEERHLNFLMNTTRKIEGGGKNIIDHSKINVVYE